MASIKVKFRPSTASGREGSIYYQVIHGRIVRQVKTDYRIFDTEWDKRTSSVKILSEIGENRKRYLREVVEHIDWDTRRLKAIVVQCDRQGGIYSADSIVEKFNGQTGEQSLFRFMQGIIGQLKQLGKVRTSETYTAALASFMKFREGQDILLCEIDGNTMMLYEAWLKGKGICPNTVSFYMRILRAVYNRAVEKELTEQKHPFKHVYTGIGKTVKRAIPLKSIKHIKELDLTLKPHLDYARDMFLFGCYTGVCYADVVSITHENLYTDEDGALWLKYRRKKNELRASVKLLPEAIALIEKYHSEDRDTLFPLLHWSNLRRHMKALAALAGIKDDLCYHQARHSFASLITLEAGVPIETISRMLGHSDISTTQVYARVSPKKLFEDMDKFIEATKDFQLVL